KAKDISLSKTPRKVRLEIWHFLKNLSRNHENQKYRDILNQAYEWMCLWHKIRYPSDAFPLDKIGVLMESGNKADWKKIHRVSENYYGYLVNPYQQDFEPEQPVEGEKMFDTKPVDYTQQSQKKFGILIVEDSGHELRRFKDTFERLAKNHRDGYEIEILTVNPESAYSDAIDMLKEHTSIKAAVIDWDLSGGKYSDEKGGRTGYELISEIRSKWHDIYTCVLTGRGILSLFLDYKDFNVRPFAKHDATALEEIFADIIEFIKQHEKTPFFSALKDYSARPVTNLHALITSRGKSLKKSNWLQDFYNFYGEQVFMAESSSALPPLDSLLEPKGSIAEAHKRAADVFGAKQTFFVTNGTSTANKIVHQATLKPGDKVLIDRNCHKSHHYGLVLTGAQPVYLQTEPLYCNIDDTESDEGIFTGICTGVTTREILHQIDHHPDAKMLCLTNCTFDGHVHDAKTIIVEVLNKLQKKRQETDNATRPEDFVFLFDEAWFGYARFLPDLRPYTAMHACKGIDAPAKPRVYATQSTHKTLTAFRQSSMIHVSDPQFDKISHSFDEALFTHTSTSPSYNLIASLDVGRMQADMEGYRLCKEARDLAIDFREIITKDEKVNEYFYLLNHSDMGARLPEIDIKDASPVDSDFFFDMTKLTLFIRKKAGMTGGQLKARLLNDFNIQVNKTTHNTILLIVNAGSTESSLGHLFASLRSLSMELDEKSPGERKDEISGNAFKKRLRSFVDNIDEDTADDDASQPIPLREAFFGQFPEHSFDESISFNELKDEIKNGALFFSRRFIIPYPPGFPILVPGQLVTENELDFLKVLSGSEIHGISEKGKLMVTSIKGQKPG
ncbi:hypothetical protein ACFL03_16065, partial [Thermodesulfobacteriota bacterium]